MNGIHHIFWQRGGAAQDRGGRFRCSWKHGRYAFGHSRAVTILTTQEVAMSHNPTTLGSFVAGTPRRNRSTFNLAAALGQRVKAALHHWEKRRAVRTLQELDDWTLNDIGLTRNEIRRFVGDVLVPAPRKFSPSRMGRSPDRLEDLSPTRSDARLYTKKKKAHVDAYLSWRDL
jgi:uncharacterized protein YjiS (DUF1127 family)